MPDHSTLPHPEARPKPAPPAQLWGLWVTGGDRPEGYWWNHAHGFRERGDTPMTFISREDAEATLEVEEAELDNDEAMEVALIGVAPASQA